MCIGPVKVRADMEAMAPRVLLVPHRLHDPFGTGIHRYGIELIRALAADETNVDLDYAVASIDDPDVAVGPPVVHIAPPRRALHLAWATAGRPAIERYVGDTALVHVLTPAVPVATAAPLVVTIHDLLPLRFPSWYPARQRWLFRRAIHQAASDAARVVVPSEAVAADVVDGTDIEPARITVVPEGVEPIFRRPVSEVDVAAVCARHGVRPGRFFLFVGAVSGRKNLVTAMRALAAFRAGGPDVPLVVAGPEAEAPTSSTPRPPSSGSRAPCGSQDSSRPPPSPCCLRRRWPSCTRRNTRASGWRHSRPW